MKKNNDIFIIKLVIIINFFSMFVAFAAGCQSGKVADSSVKTASPAYAQEIFSDKK